MTTLMNGFSIPPHSRSSSPQVTAEGELVFSVSSLTQHAKQVLERSLGDVTVQGEISNLTLAKSGHSYFTLKDPFSQIRCTFFSGNTHLLRLTIENGSEVRLTGKVSVYLERGDMQLLVTSIESMGLGTLQQHMLALKEKLMQRGWFDPRLKRPLPTYPQHLGIVTSAHGAALQDVLAVLRKRWPLLPIRVFDASVQGNTAVSELINALKTAYQDPEIDLVLLTRGGGSLEDLMAFNDENLAKAIFERNKPVISAVGHEVDFSISDFVADLRAPTPSAAAEQLSADQETYLKQLLKYRQHMILSTQMRLSLLTQQLIQFTKRIDQPTQQVEQLSKQVDHIQRLLLQVIHRRLIPHEKALDAQRMKLQNLHPLQRLNYWESQLASVNLRLRNQLSDRFNKYSTIINLYSSKLSILNPFSLMSKGFCVIKNEKNKILTDASEAQIGDKIKVLFQKSSLDVEVIAQHPDQNL